MAYKPPKIKTPQPIASGVSSLSKAGESITRPIADKLPDWADPIAKGPTTVLAEAAMGSPGSSIKKWVNQGEETFGGKESQKTKDAIDRQKEAGEAGYRESEGVLGQMKGADETYQNESERNSGWYRDDRDKTFKEYLDSNSSAATGYKDKRDTSIKKQLEGDAEATKKYRETRNPIYEKYQTKLSDLSTESENQAKDAKKTYDNVLQPRLMDIMSQAQSEAGGAMSLKDAGDPNNSVNKAWRDMYDQRAQGVGKQALADVGIMNALGAQATASQLGGRGAIGTNQLLALQGQNMAQGGMAYARAQQQMQALRDQGLETGRQESAAQYGRGQAAKDRYSSSVGDYQRAGETYQDRMAGYRGEQGGLANRGFEVGRQQAGEDYTIDQDRVGLEAGLSRGAASEDYGIQKQLSQQNFDLGDRKNTENLNINSGLSGLKHSLSGDQAARQLSAINQRYSTQAGIAANQAGVGQQQQIMGPQILGGLVGTGVRAGASMYGGGGAAAAPAGSDQPAVTLPQKPAPGGAVPTSRAGEYDIPPDQNPNGTYGYKPRRYGNYA